MSKMIPRTIMAAGLSVSRTLCAIDRSSGCATRAPVHHPRAVCPIDTSPNPLLDGTFRLSSAAAAENSTVLLRCCSSHGRSMRTDALHDGRPATQAG
jgi:hypothetical protein